MKLQAYINADTNDGDYVSTLFDVTIKEVEILRRVAEAIKSFKSYDGDEISPGHHFKHSHNFPTRDIVREDLGELSAEDYYVTEHNLITKEDFEFFEENLPYNEYGIHTIECIEIREKPAVLDRFL